MFLWSSERPLTGLTRLNSLLFFCQQQLPSPSLALKARWQQLRPDSIKDLLRSYSSAFYRCSLSYLLSSCKVPACPSAQLEKKKIKSDPPGGKRWRRSTCSPSAHCPLQLPGPWKDTTGLIFNSSFLLALLLRLLPFKTAVKEPVNPTMYRSMLPCCGHHHRSATHLSPAVCNHIFIYHPN